MAVADRRQREIAERERLFLGIARRLLLERGFGGLTMERVADEAEYAKGTVYQHFDSKEDLVGAVQLEVIERRASFFSRAASFEGTSRERVCAIGVADEAFIALHHEYGRLEQLLEVAPIFDKVNERRRDQLRDAKRRMMAELNAVVEDAIAAGHLELPPGHEPRIVLYGLWSLAAGHEQIRAAGQYQLTPQLEGADPGELLWANYARLLDGYGWRPLSHEWDYRATLGRIRAEVFGDEFRAIDRARVEASA